MNRIFSRPETSLQPSVSDQQQVNQAIKVEEVKEGDDYSDNVTCKICMTNKVNMVYIPCGHCFCSECDNRNTKRLCPICRKSINSTQKFYI